MPWRSSGPEPCAAGSCTTRPRPWAACSCCAASPRSCWTPCSSAATAWKTSGERSPGAVLGHLGPGRTGLGGSPAAWCPLHARGIPVLSPGSPGQDPPGVCNAAQNCPFRQWALVEGFFQPGTLQRSPAAGSAASALPSSRVPAQPAETVPSGKPPRQLSCALALNHSLGQAAETTQSHERVSDSGDFLSHISTMPVFVEINPTFLSDLCFAGCSFSTCTSQEPLSGHGALISAQLPKPTSSRFALTKPSLL